MITKKAAHFECDRCGKEEESEIMTDLHENSCIRLPEGWQGDLYGENFCSLACVAAFRVKKAHEKQGDAP